MVTVEVRVERMDILLLPIMVVEEEAAVIMAVLEPGTFRDTNNGNNAGYDINALTYRAAHVVRYSTRVL